MTDVKDDSKNSARDARDDSAFAVTEPHKTNDLALLRREFFRRAALASGSALVASVVASTEAGAAEEPDCQAYFPEYFDVDATYAKETNGYYFQGFTLMLYVYGHFKCRDLFTRRLKWLIPIVSNRVQCAVSILSKGSLLSQADADEIKTRLDLIMRMAPNANVRELYLLDDHNITGGTLAQVQALCREIDQLGLALPFAFQVDDSAVEAASEALADLHDKSIVRHLGQKTLIEMYLAPFKEIASEARIRAISRAKEGRVFGRKTSQSGVTQEGGYSMSLTGMSKGNERICLGDGSGCTTCSNDDTCFCTTDEYGHCTLMSDMPGNCNC